MVSVRVRLGFEDRLHERLGDVGWCRIMCRCLRQQHGLLEGLEIRHARRADAEMAIELAARLRIEFIIAIAADEIDQLLAGDIGLGRQGILPLNVERRPTSLLRLRLHSGKRDVSAPGSAPPHNTP